MKIVIGGRREALGMLGGQCPQCGGLREGASSQPTQGAAGGAQEKGQSTDGSHG